MKQAQPYIVLARKYRPQDFTQLVGQDNLVITLNNSIKLNRIAHAFLLTGIRGIGKTTTARIIAKTINCSDIQQQNGIYVPCGKCQNCLACSQQSHPDIIELDAASKTGVNDIREVIENSSYAPIMGKYKIYIIDEVHMLSNSAFNALLKTLEEPPAHLKFIFATTEHRKIPLTIISRCQKYDLQRFNQKELFTLLNSICNKEKVEFEEDAIKTIAIYAQGSARDGLSLLDMIILNAKDAKITNEYVEKTLGVTNKSNLFKLFEALLDGNVEYCLTTADQLLKQGQDPLYLLEDLLEICTNIAKAKSFDQALENIITTDFEKNFIKTIMTKTDLPKLSRTWQMLFKGFNELKLSDMPLQTIEMLFIRICYLSDKPSPIEIHEQLKKNTNFIAPTKENKERANILENSSSNKLNISDYSQLVELFKINKEMILYYHLKQDIVPIHLSKNELQIKLVHSLDQKVIKQLQEKLANYTGQHWQITIAPQTNDSNLMTLEQKELEDIKNNEIIKAVFENFEDAKLSEITTSKDN
jgi:DNA polymerase-3 subunit gamma/tau